MKMNEKFRKGLSTLLCLGILVQYVPAVVWAAEDNLCEHHAEHTADCGYVSAEDAVPCQYVCEQCGSEQIPDEVVPETTEEEQLPETTPVEATSGMTATYVPDTDLPDNDELFAMYAEQVFYGNEMSAFGTKGRAGLNKVEQGIYDALKARIEAVASGGGSTEFMLSDLSFMTTSWTNKDLGVTYITDDDVRAAINNQFDRDKIVDALLHDCPFALYWYDKTGQGGVKISAEWGYSGPADGKWTYLEITSVYFCFTVAREYRGSTNYVTTDVAKINAVRTAAQAVVNANTGKSDYEKLTAYKEYICGATAYNDAAAEDDYSGGYGNPWQLIYVFDGNPSTNVVCEGYAKAFQYLCDLTDFSGDVSCYTVTGAMDGGGHMWNIITLEGKNYLVDVTNSDTGTIGQWGGLFLVGGSGNANNGYTFLGTRFQYDEDTKTMWGTGADSILTLAEEDYTETDGEIGTTIIDEEDFWITEDITLEENILVADGASVFIDEGVTVTVPSGIELNIQGYMEVYGNLIFEDGGILTITDSLYRRLSIWWLGYLDATGADLSGVPYGAVELQLNSDAEISGIPDEMIFATTYVYNTEDIHAALAIASNYEYLLMYVDSSFALTSNITIPANAELHIWQLDENTALPTFTIPNGVTVTNNGGFTINDGQIIVKKGATLINNDYAAVGTDAELIVYGEFQQNGTFKGHYRLEADDDAYTVIDEAEYWFLEDITLTENTLITEGTSVYIDEGVTVTIPAGIELNIQGYMEVYGNLIFEDGGILTITDEYLRSLCIWTGKLDVTGADISGVPYGAVEIQLNSTAEIAGIPEEMLYATTYVYSTEDINNALKNSSEYYYFDLASDSSFTLTNSITIPENTEWYLWKWYSDERSNPTITIPAGVTVTNNGWFTVQSNCRMVFEPGSTLINHGSTYGDPFGSLLIHGDFQQNGTFEGKYYERTISQAELERELSYCAENGYGWVHESETTLESDMTIDLGEKEFSMSKYGSLIVPDGVTLTLNSSVCTYTYDYGDLEIGNITVENGGKLIINDYLTTHDDAGYDLILEDGAYLEVNGWLLANGNIKIGKNAVVKVNGYWVGRAPTNNGGRILPAVTSISVVADNSVVDLETTEYITLQVSVTPDKVVGATWTSSNPDIIDPVEIVDFSEGKYRAYLGDKAGIVTLTATSIDGSGKTASVTLEVTKQGGCNGKHTVVIDEAVPATCTTPGLTEGKHCSECGETLVEQSVVKATGKHIFVDGTCKFCDLPEPERGDLNGDGDRDGQDAVQLLWHVLFPEIYPQVIGEADFDHNGTVDAKDAEYLVWHTLFPVFYPLV